MHNSVSVPAPVPPFPLGDDPPVWLPEPPVGVPVPGPALPPVQDPPPHLTQ